MYLFASLIFSLDFFSFLIFILRILRDQFQNEKNIDEISWIKICAGRARFTDVIKGQSVVFWPAHKQAAPQRHRFHLRQMRSDGEKNPAGVRCNLTHCYRSVPGKGVRRKKTWEEQWNKTIKETSNLWIRTTGTRLRDREKEFIREIIWDFSSQQDGSVAKEIKCMQNPAM